MCACMSPFERGRLRGPAHMDHTYRPLQDDRLILAEGLENLNADELRSACKVRVEVCLGE